MKRQHFFLICLIISLILHFSTFTLVSLQNLLSKNTKKPQEIDVEILTSKEDFKKMQIVEQSSKPLNDEVDDKAKYLGQFNQKVIKETKATKSGRFNNQAAQGLAKKAVAKNSNKKSGKREKSLTGDMGILQKFMPEMDWSNLAKKNENQGVENPGEISKTDDYLKDTDTGAQTLLSTREFIYYTYFNRIKAQIQQQWEPRIKTKITKLFIQGRKIASDRDHITKLLIILNSKGTLVGVQIINESGLIDLDDAAVEAFKAAAPFPNPPAGIVEKDGKIKIQWDFILEV